MVDVVLDSGQIVGQVVRVGVIFHEADGQGATGVDPFAAVTTAPVTTSQSVQQGRRSLG